MSGDSQVLIENGRVSSLFKFINGVSIVLISALLIWVATSLSALNVQVAVLISQNETRMHEHSEMRATRLNDHSRINERISALERERGDRLDHRDE